MDNRHVILVVEDDEVTLALLSRFFSKRGYEARQACDAAHALSMLNGVDIVVTDYEMPGLNGVDFRMMVRSRYPDLPVIGITGVRDLYKLRGHFDDFLLKPFHLKELRHAVEKLLGRLFSVPFC